MPRDFNKDLRALEVNKTQIMTQACGYPVEVTVGEFSYVVTTRTDLDELIKTLKERHQQVTKVKAPELPITLNCTEVLMLLDTLDDKYAGRGDLISNNTRQTYKKLCSKLHQILQKL